MSAELTTLDYKLYTTDEQIETLSKLAETIWHECYSKILSNEQIEYMLTVEQSPESLKEQIQNGTSYYVIEIDHTPVGYYAYELRNDDALYGKEYIFISKMYLRADIRHKGLASLIMKQLRKYARKNGLEYFKLYVNRKNEHAISVYKHKGLRIISEIDRDLGNGFTAEDYIMGKMV